MDKYAVIGHPIAHSLSPVIHKANFAALGIYADYAKFDVSPENLSSFIREKQREGYRGLNITVPFKTAVLDLLDVRDESVVRYGSCNTIKFCDDSLIYGYNTDIYGFLDSLEANGFSLNGSRVMILGCGGAGGAMARCAVYEGAAEVLLVGRTQNKVDSLATELEKIPSSSRVTRPHNEDLVKSAYTCDIVVNATPVGLKEGDVSLLPRDAFRPGQFVLDIIPTRALPPMASIARSAGAVSCGGLNFLVAQGAKSFEIWTGLKADVMAMSQSIM